MKTLKITMKSDLSNEYIEELYDELGIESDVELAAIIKGIFIGNISTGNFMSMDYIDVKIEDDLDGGVLN